MSLRQRSQPLQQGFTLIELMTVIFVLSILLAIAIPSFNGFTLRYRLTATSNDFLSSITLARNEAMKRGRRVDMIPIGGDWANGWDVFVDLNGDQTINGAEEVIITHGPIDTSITVSDATINATDCTSSAGVPMFDNVAGETYIAYSGTGYRTRNTGIFTTEQAVLFTTPTDNHTRCLIITPIGRPRTLSN